MPTYRLRSEKDLLLRALNKGIRPTGSAIGLAAGLPASTINQLIRNRPPSNSTMGALTRLFGCSVEDLFELDEDVDRVSA